MKLRKPITRSTTIDGGGQITLTGGLATRLFRVSGGVTLTLRNIVLDAFNSAGEVGGAILSNGTLVLENTTIQYSQTDADASGGAIYSTDQVIIRNSTLRKNSAGSGGALGMQGPSFGTHDAHVALEVTLLDYVENQALTLQPPQVIHQLIRVRPLRPRAVIDPQEPVRLAVHPPLRPHDRPRPKAVPPRQLLNPELTDHNPPSHMPSIPMPANMTDDPDQVGK